MPTGRGWARPRRPPLGRPAGAARGARPLPARRTPREDRLVARRGEARDRRAPRRPRHPRPRPRATLGACCFAPPAAGPRGRWRVGGPGATMRRVEGLPPGHARRGSADHHRAASERALGGDRHLDRGGVARRGRRTRGPFALPRAPALQGRDSRTPRWRSRRCSTRWSGELNASTARGGRLRARAGRAPAAGARRDDGHGVRARARRPRDGAPRSSSRIAMIEDTPPSSSTSSRRRCSATIRSAGPYSGSAEGDLVGDAPVDRGVHRAQYRRTTSSSRRGLGRPTRSSVTSRGSRNSAPARGQQARVAAALHGRAAAVAALRPQGDGAVPRVPRRARDREDGPASASLLVLDGILGGRPRRGSSGRSGRPSRTPSTPSRPSTDTGAGVGVYVGVREDNLGECLDVVAHELAAVAAGDVREDEDRAGEEDTEGGSCSRSS